MSGAGLGYSIVDTRSTFTGYLGAGKILAPKSDDVAGKTEADAATDVISLWFDQVDDFLDEINEIFTNEKAVPIVLKIGDGSGNSALKLNTSASGTGYIEMLDAGAARWRIWYDGGDDDLNIHRYVGGSYQDTPLTIKNSNGNVQVDATLEVVDANAKLDMGDYSGAPEIRLGKGASSSAVIYFEQAASTSTNDKQINLNSSEELTFRHYNGTSWSTAFKISNNGYLQLRSSGSQLLSGTGVPGSGTGSNGDFWFRTNGGVGTSLYVKISGSWNAIA